MAIRVSDPPLYLPVNDPIWIDWVSQLISALDLLVTTYGDGGIKNSDVALDFYINGFKLYTSTITNNTWAAATSGLRIISNYAYEFGIGGVYLQVGTSSMYPVTVMQYYYNYSGITSNVATCQTFVPPGHVFKYTVGTYKLYPTLIEFRK